jgi:hypothetical protein
MIPSRRKVQLTESNLSPPTAMAGPERSSLCGSQLPRSGKTDPAKGGAREIACAVQDGVSYRLVEDAHAMLPVGASLGAAPVKSPFTSPPPDRGRPLIRLRAIPRRNQSW